MPYVSIMTHGAVLTALSDPTRRQVFERLRAGPRSVTEVANTLPVSRPAVSQHLKVLSEAGLVEHERQGRRRLYTIRREGLESLRAWVDAFWDDALSRYAQTLMETPGENR